MSVGGGGLRQWELCEEKGLGRETLKVKILKTDISGKKKKAKEQNRKTRKKESGGENDFLGWRYQGD